MRIIKLQVEVPSKRGGTKLVKQAICLKKRSHRNLDHFIQYVKNMCGLKGNYTISIDGFTFTPFDTVQILQEGRIYRLAISKKRNILPLEPSSSSEASEPESEEVDSQESISDQQELVQKTKKSKTKNIKSVSKKMQKNSKVQEKKIKPHQSSESESQSSYSSEKKIKPPQKKSDSTPKCLPQNKSKHNRPTEVEKKTLKPKNNEHLNKNTKSESQSEDSSSQQLPHIPKKAEIVQKTQLKIQKTKPAVINGDSDSQSSPSPQQQPSKKQKTSEIHQNTQLVVNKPTQQPLKIPPALRNMSKPVPRKNFEQHQADQWLPLDKQKLLLWKQRGHKTFCQCPNKIRFKVIQFDEQKFIPVKSGWIKGEVSSVQQNGTVHLIDVDQQGTKQFKKEYNIPEHNMDELQIWKPLASKQQIEVLVGPTKEKQLEKSECVIIPQEKAVQNDSIQKFICGQVNYYFSDRNYSTDFFLQLHANSHPQKYVKLSLMLNFPKIKKLLRDQQKLYQYLKEDEKYSTRNYEIDFQQRLIKKKDIKDPREMHAQNKTQKIQVREEKEAQPESYNGIKNTQEVQQVCNAEKQAQ